MCSYSRKENGTSYRDEKGGGDGGVLKGCDRSW